jgi:DNA-binding MarR family transcriptional regulator
MNSDLLEKVALELISIPPLIHRSVQRTFSKKSNNDFDINITRNHFEILRLLEEEGTLQVAEIGQKLHISKAQMTHLIDKLVMMKFVEREPSTSDRRAINISLSTHGRKTMEEKKIGILNAIKESISTLTVEDLKHLSESLRNLKDTLSKLG